MLHATLWSSYCDAPHGEGPLASVGIHTSPRLRPVQLEVFQVEVVQVSCLSVERKTHLGNSGDPGGRETGKNGLLALHLSHKLLLDV